MWKILKKHKKYLIFVLTIVLLGLLFGIAYYLFLDSNTKINIISSIKDSFNFNYNFIIKHLIIMSIILVTSFFVIGSFLGLFYLFYDSLTIGFLICAFLATFKGKGLIYILSYIFINKIITFILFIIFIKKCLNISRYVVGLFIYKKDRLIIDKMFINFKKSLIIIAFVIVVNIILYFFYPFVMRMA